VWGGSFAKLEKNDILYKNLKLFFTFMIIVRMISIFTKVLSIPFINDFPSVEPEEAN